MKKVTKLEKSIEEQIAQYGEKLLFSEAEYNRDNAEDGGYSNYSYWRSTWRSFTKNKVAMFFMYLLIAVLLFTIIQPMLPNQKDPNEIFWVGTAPDMNHRPDSEFWFGTNSTGSGPLVQNMARHAHKPADRHCGGLLQRVHRHTYRRAVGLCPHA